MLLNLTQPKSIISLVKYALGSDRVSITACFGICDAQPSITKMDKVELEHFLTFHRVILSQIQLGFA
jgi:hypothetical protein